jgi:DNA-binding PadR family transcriptional regulator
MDDVLRLLPLTTQQFQILLSLTDGHLHGYGIIRDVAARTDGGLRLGTGTLYTALARLETLALVEETDPRSRAKDDDERRRYYRLTPLGRAVLKAETDRLDALVRQARHKGILPLRHRSGQAARGPALSRSR